MTRALAHARRECGKHEAMVELLQRIHSIKDGDDMNSLVENLVAVAYR
jgi:hypothetical protein